MTKQTFDAHSMGEEKRAKLNMHVPGEPAKEHHLNENARIKAAMVNMEHEERRIMEAALSPSPLHAMLDERGSRYGKFVDHARVTQAMKAIVYDELRRGDKRLMPDQIEALDMITHAIGRIVAGNADHKEPWIDISIYATLVADRLKGEER